MYDTVIYTVRTGVSEKFEVQRETDFFTWSTWAEFPTAEEAKQAADNYARDYPGSTFRVIKRAKVEGKTK